MSKPAVPSIPVNTIGRLSLYRRLLLDMAAAGLRHTYSHQLADAAISTSAQVRRDLMTIGFSGSPRHGYAIPRPGRGHQRRPRPVHRNPRRAGRRRKSRPGHPGVLHQPASPGCASPRASTAIRRRPTASSTVAASTTSTSAEEVLARESIRAAVLRCSRRRCPAGGRPPRPRRHQELPELRACSSQSPRGRLRRQHGHDHRARPRRLLRPSARRAVTFALAGGDGDTRHPGSTRFDHRRTVPRLLPVRPGVPGQGDPHRRPSGAGDSRALHRLWRVLPGLHAGRQEDPLGGRRRRIAARRSGPGGRHPGAELSRRVHPVRVHRRSLARFARWASPPSTRWRSARNWSPCSTGSWSPRTPTGCGSPRRARPWSATSGGITRG